MAFDEQLRVVAEFGESLTAKLAQLGPTNRGQ